MTDEDLKTLGAAVRVLEHPGLVARLGSMVGKPIDLIRQALPAGATQAIAAATTKALDAALAVALRSIRNNPGGSRLLHKVMATASGAVGGSVGLVALPVELPISTIIMLRSIAEIARSEGEDLADPETALACIEVFALGGRAGGDDAADSGYFAVRGVLAKSVSEAARFIAERGIVSEGAPLLAAFIAQVASRFGVVVTQKLAAQILPVVGALGGAAVNYAFIDHFQEVARAHFTVRRLERRYGKDAVHAEYERLRDGTSPTSAESAEEQVRSVHRLEASIARTKGFP
jgi:EcsC protein family